MLKHIFSPRSNRLAMGQNRKKPSDHRAKAFQKRRQKVKQLFPKQVPNGFWLTTKHHYKTTKKTTNTNKKYIPQFLGLQNFSSHLEVQIHFNSPGKVTRPTPSLLGALVDNRRFPWVFFELLVAFPYKKGISLTNKVFEGLTQNTKESKRDLRDRQGQAREEGPSKKHGSHLLSFRHLAGTLQHMTFQTPWTKNHIRFTLQTPSNTTSIFLWAKTYKPSKQTNLQKLPNNKNLPPKKQNIPKPSHSACPARRKGARLGLSARLSAMGPSSRKPSARSCRASKVLGKLKMFVTCHGSGRKRKRDQGAQDASLCGLRWIDLKITYINS